MQTKFLGRTPKSNKSPRNFPQIAKTRQRTTPRTTRGLGDYSEQISVFSNLIESVASSSDKDRAHKFFNLAKKQRNFNSGKNAKRSKSISLHTDTAVKEKVLLKGSRDFYWEVLERLEAFEIRLSSRADFPRTAFVINEEFQLWETCQEELLPLIRTQSKQAAVVLEKLRGHTRLLLKELNSLYEKQTQQLKEKQKLAQEKIRNQSEKMKEIEEKQKESEKLQQQEFQKIKKEVDDLFGSQDPDYLSFKNRSAQFHNIRPAGTSSVLKELYLDMTKERSIPVQKEFDISAISPKDLENGLLKNFLSLQRETAARIIQIYQKKGVQVDKSSQTLAEYIPPEIHQKISNQAEKFSLQYTSASQLLEKVKEELNYKNSIVQKLESQRQQMMIESAQNRRDFQAADKELKSSKRDNQFLLKDKRELEKQFEVKLRDLSWFQDKHEQQNRKIKELTNQLEKVNNSLKQKNSKIESLKKKMQIDFSEEQGQSVEEDKHIDSYVGRRSSVAHHNKNIKKEYSKEEIPSLRAPEISIMQARPRRRRKQYQNEGFQQEKEQKQPENQALRQQGRFGTNQQRFIQKTSYWQNQSKRSIHKIQENRVKSIQDNFFRQNLTSQQQGTRKSTDHQENQYNRNSGLNERLIREVGDNGTYNYRMGYVPQTHQILSSDNSIPVRKSSIRDRKRKIRNPDDQKKTDSSTGSPFIKPERSPKPKKSGSLRRQTRKGTKKKTKASSQEEFDHDFMQERDSWAEHAVNSGSLGNGSSPLGSNTREMSILQDSPVTIGKKRKIKDLQGNLITLIEKGVQVNLGNLPVKIGYLKSVGIQFNWENPIEEELQKEVPQQLYLLPFNPNSIYGLRGDTYYSGVPKTFSAQPRIPELSSSLVFKNAFKVDEKRIVNLDCL